MNELEWPKLNLTNHSGFKKGELAVIGCYNPNRQGKSWISSELDYKSKCDDILIGRAANTTAIVEVQFDQNMSSLEFLQSLQGRSISVGYDCDWFIIDDFKAWMPRTKLLQSKSKQSRLVKVRLLETIK